MSDTVSRSFFFSFLYLKQQQAFSKKWILKNIFLLKD